MQNYPGWMHCVLNIGEHGENLAVAIQFDISDWIAEYSPGAAAAANNNDKIYITKRTTKTHAITW